MILSEMIATCTAEDPVSLGVVLNLLTNAFYVVDEKKKSGIVGYEPTVSITTKKVADKVFISVTDNGNLIINSLPSPSFVSTFISPPCALIIS